MYTEHFSPNFVHKIIIAMVFTISTLSCSVISTSQSYQQEPEYPIILGEFPLRKLWYFVAGGKIITTPVIGEGKVFIRTNKSIYAIDELSGEPLWDSPLPAGNEASPVMFSNGIVFSPYKGGVKAIDAVDGRVIWDRDLITYGSEAKIMAITIDQVFVNLASDSVNVLNIQSGKLEWTKHTGRGSTEVFPDNEYVYFLEGKKLTAYNINTGDQLWEKEIRLAGINFYKDGILFYSPVIDLRRNFLAAFDIRKQFELWKITTSEDVISISYIENKLFVSLSSSLMCIDPENGFPIWRSDSLGDEFQRSIKIGQSIYVKSSFSKEIYAFSESDGKVQGSIMIGKPSHLFSDASDYSGDVATTGKILVFVSGNKIFAYGK